MVELFLFSVFFLVCFWKHLRNLLPFYMPKLSFTHGSYSTCLWNPFGISDRYIYVFIIPETGLFHKAESQSNRVQLQKTGGLREEEWVWDKKFQDTLDSG